jgi:alkanesulfonate monooxygenase SsuD/methylene tetrahydromethanopterin reductase-like flavin-dependent oxidoreductase (luciferase family)
VTTPSSFELGVDTFGDVTHDASGQPRPQAQVLREVIEQAVIAEQAGLDCFGVGEFPLTLAIIGGNPQRFRPYVDLYTQSIARFGYEAQRIAVHSPGHVADTDEEAKEQLWPHFAAMMGRIGAERGWPPPTRANFEQEVRGGALCVGSPETVAAKIAATVKALGLSRFALKYSNGALPHPQLVRSLELLGTLVVPRVRELLAER